jgi:hypothetical protein
MAENRCGLIPRLQRARWSSTNPRGEPVADVAADVGAQAKTLAREHLHAADVAPPGTIVAVQVDAAIEELDRDGVGHHRVSHHAGMTALVRVTVKRRHLQRSLRSRDFHAGGC